MESTRDTPEVKKDAVETEAAEVDRSAAEQPDTAAAALESMYVEVVVVVTVGTLNLRYTFTETLRLIKCCKVFNDFVEQKLRCSTPFTLYRF